VHNIFDLRPVRFSKTIGETDVYLFAGITGDFAANHVDEEAMKRTAFGRRIAHGALMVGYMSTASTMMAARGLSVGENTNPVSLGYDRMRFLKPVFLGDTVTVTYAVTSIDEQRQRSEANVEVSNQRGELVAVATHIMKWVANPPAE